MASNLDKCGGAEKKDSREKVAQGQRSCPPPLTQPPRLTHSTSGDSMKEASSSDSVTSMLAARCRSPVPHRCAGQWGRYPQRARGGSPHGTEQSPRVRHRFTPPPASCLHELPASTTIVSRCPVSLNSGVKNV